VATDPYGDVACAAVCQEAEELPHMVKDETPLVEEQLGDLQTLLESLNSQDLWIILHANHEG
jgi:hypothetical protein